MAVAVLLRALGFNSLSNGVMRILTDQLNSHIEKIAKAQNIPIHWWPSVDGGTDGAKQKYVQEKYTTEYKGKDNHVYCILTDNELSQTFACRELTSKTGKKFERLYKCRKPVKQYNKTGFFIRTETTINNPKSLGLKKPVLFLQAALWTGIECNDRMLNCCADVDVASIFESEPDKFSQPVVDD